MKSFSTPVTTRIVFRSQSNIYDGDFLLLAVNFFSQKRSIIDVRLDSKYSSVSYHNYILYTCIQFKPSEFDDKLSCFFVICRLSCKNVIIACYQCYWNITICICVCFISWNNFHQNFIIYTSVYYASYKFNPLSILVSLSTTFVIRISSISFLYLFCCLLPLLLLLPQFRKNPPEVFLGNGVPKRKYGVNFQEDNYAEVRFQ